MQASQVVTVRTPEGVAFPFTLADPGSRLVALILDKLVIYTLTGIVTTILSYAGLVSADLAFAAITVASFAISIGYAIAFEWLWRGQTPGKRWMKLQVVDEQGLRLQFSQVVVRNLLRFVDMLPAFYMLGGLACVLSPRGQRVGDFAANTIVISRARVDAPDLSEVLHGKFNSFREYGHLVARLRRNVTPAQAGVLLRAVLRRDALRDDARLALFAELRRSLENAARFPPDVTDGLSDEQYVRNVVDVLYRR